MPCCVAVNCSNRSNNHKNSVRLFRFPRDKTRCALWITKVKRDNCIEAYIIVIFMWGMLLAELHLCTFSTIYILTFICDNYDTTHPKLYRTYHCVPFRLENTLFVEIIQANCQLDWLICPHMKAVSINIGVNTTSGELVTTSASGTWVGQTLLIYG